MRKKIVLLVGMIVLMNTVFLSGCGKRHTEPSKKIHVGDIIIIKVIHF